MKILQVNNPFSYWSGRYSLYNFGWPRRTPYFPSRSPRDRLCATPWARMSARYLTTPWHPSGRIIPDQLLTPLTRSPVVR